MVHSPVISAKGVSYVYPDGSLGIQDVSIEIFKDDRIGIIGPNGSGKSTLIFLLSGLLKPTKGEVRIFGMIPDKKNVEAIRRKIGVVFQNPDDFLFNPTVKDELLYVPRQLEMSEEEMKSLLSEYSGKFGLDEILHKPPFRLSGGEKKKVEIASVLIFRPEIVFLDEPTANVDGKTRRMVAEMMRKYDGTVVITSHELGIIRELCNRVVLMSKGRIVEETTVENLSERRLEEIGVI
ncbi:MAG: ABC transporter ATP-binding protein [Archaeoglobi archaeon]|nr:MAG: ABC transporter ATP-binding protein [Archaeoglobi archaeon]TDA26077.1 MAG: ABC transporter ATP-binding protein [Archaeoglobi archaeon]TDA26433.1 MAG: ABC transporter ATP-binding protein [Archaeoglobi archaeon]